MILPDNSKYTNADSSEVFFLKGSLSRPEKITQVLRFINYMGNDDALVKYYDGLMIFSKSVFGHLDGDQLRVCVGSFLDRVESSSLRLKNQKPIKTVKMVDDSPTVADIIKNG